MSQRVCFNGAVLLLTLLALFSGGAVARKGAKKPNILFLIDESTDSKAYFATDPENAPMDLPNLRALMAKGTFFKQHYVQAPVCCPSRASTWSGRQVHHIPHQQINPATGLKVNGAWNNHEGLEPGYNLTYADVMKENGYAIGIFGKTDYTAGGHSVSARVTAWTNKVKFPYTLKNGSFGWYDEDGPVTGLSNGTEGGKVVHTSDWNKAKSLASFISQQAKAGKPWMGYAGFDIVHPDYITSDYWLSKINESRITTPKWIPLDQMHPEDLQSTMKKKMAGTCCSEDYIRKVRKYYYAMIREYDDIVGVVLDSIKEAGEWDNTYFIVTSDHGDMNMEHQQYYKMVHYDPSSRVPLIIGGPGLQENKVYTNITSQIDLYPTMMEMSGLTAPKEAGLEGRSLLSIAANGSDPGRENWSLSQFHGDEIHLSWFMLRKDNWKYVTYGSGKEVVPRLYDMDQDPLEMNDLAKAKPDVVSMLDTDLKKIIDYPAVAADVESYNKESFSRFIRTFKDENDWVEYLAKKLRWSESWSYDPAGCVKAIEDWLKTPNATFEWAF